LNTDKRSYVEFRSDYEPVTSDELFMVPLLKNNIYKYLDEYTPIANQSKRMLDIGCGRQPFRSYFENKGFNYFGLDVIQQKNIPVDYLCSLEEPLPDNLLKAEPFDFVLCLEVLEHVADWNMLFDNLRQITKKGCYVLITCAAFYQIHCEPFDFWRPTPFAIEHFALKSGFETVKSEKVGDAWDIIGTILATSKLYIGSRKIWDRLIFRIINFCRKWLLKNLISRRIQSKYELNSLFYMSNFIVLRKI